MNKKANILITGGAGFIGSNIVDYLVRSGHQGKIRVFDNLSSGNLANIEEHLTENCIEFLYGDMKNLEDCRKAIQGMDLICHQAAVGSVPRSIADPLLSHSNNVNGFFNILIAAKEQNIKRIVYASSSSVYGDHPVLPKKEENTGNLLSPYAATKAIKETYANVFTRCYNMECIGLRYFNVFGPKQNPNGIYSAVIPRFIKQIRNGVSPEIYGDGSYSRDFTYVDNAVSANILALTTTNSKCFGEVYNIGAGGRTTILNLVNTIKEHLSSNIEIKIISNRAGDIPHSNADVSKALRDLNYKPLINFSQGIQKLCEMSFIS